jgi:hypothetical protein
MSEIDERTKVIDQNGNEVTVGWYRETQTSDINVGLVATEPGEDLPYAQLYLPVLEIHKLIYRLVDLVNEAADAIEGQEAGE